MESQLKLETLDTSYVSLASLIRHLRQRQFQGRLHVALDGFEAAVVIHGAAEPEVWEKDLTSGRETSGEEAKQRVLVRAREPGCLITIYEGTPESTLVTEEALTQTVGMNESGPAQLITSSSAIIAAVERAVESAGVNFTSIFRQVRVEFGDDYPIIDPTIGGFEYADTKVVLTANPSPATFQQALVNCLKRVVDQVALNNGEASFRERVAVELAIAARRNAGHLGNFESELDRIAGTRVL